MSAATPAQASDAARHPSSAGDSVRTPPKRPRAFPVVEVFGSTIQGEGALAGLPTHFVRFGGCDYLCSWCDSLHAVLPEHVRLADRLTADEITQKLADLEGAPDWVTLSGGNPALLELGPLVDLLHDAHYKVAVETQGSRWRDWLADVDCLTVSPKAPSSGMVTDRHTAETTAFMTTAGIVPTGRRCLKIVVFDQADFEWASAFLRRWRGWPAFLSAGTDRPTPGESLDLTRVEVCDRYRWLCELVAKNPDFGDVRVLPQLHVLAWGHALGV